jgi:dipeptidyl aminopeptidase/acylaminoacyl peptidase
MNKLILLLLVIFLIGDLQTAAQNGKVLDRKEFKAPSSYLNELKDQNPESNYEDSFALVKMERLTYESNKLKVKAYMVKPAKPGKYPVLIYNRDGYKEFGLINELFCAAELSHYARWGYVVIASQYRGYEGEEGKDEIGGEEIHDVLNLIPLLASEPSADTSRIGMYGFNRGGMMTYQALTRTQKIDAAIVESGISNFYLYAAIHAEDGFYETMEQMIPEYWSDKSGAIRKRSMAYWPDDLNPETPILILHGSSDWEVHPAESTEASDVLFRIRFPHRLILYEGGSNGLPEFKEEKLATMRLWLNKYVRDQKKYPTVINLERR